jgi:uncharacterized protein involved in cysteine biosynthesis
MPRMLSALARSFNQLPDPRFKRVMWRAFFWSVLLFAFVIAATWTGAAQIAPFENDWLNTTLQIVSGAGSVFLAFLLFPGIISAVISLFLEDVAEAVDARHYNDLPAARPVPLAEQLSSGARLLGWIVVLNLAILPLHLFAQGLNLFVYYGVNGYLLGREYFELVALRRMDMGAARELRRRHRTYVTLAGAVIAGLLSIPILGWFMPVVATAFMVHLVEALRTKRSAAST